MSLANTTVIILGGSTGIGLATAKAALAEGAHVTITGRSAEKLQAAQAALGSAVRTVALDATDEAGTRALFEEMDHLDHVFITAGAIVFDPGLQPSSEALRPAMDTRFWGAVYAAKYSAPKIRPGGSITFMSGGAAVKPLAGASIVTASCAAVDTLARALAIDLAPVRVNTIRPGPVDTPLLDEMLGDRRNQWLAEYAAKLPVKRTGRAEEIADAVLFMMKNEFVTGIALTVDGGAVLV